MVKFIRRMALIDTHALTLRQKDIIFNKINEMNQDHHFAKFDILVNSDSLAGSDRRHESEDIVDYVKKVCLC
jgi:hypothetical protein